MLPIPTRPDFGLGCASIPEPDWRGAMKPKHVVKARLRIMSGEEIALGPGKVELLGLIAETGSLRQAAARMDMSYMRAWSLVRLMNASFRLPLVEAVRGGRTGGGAQLTPEGREVLALYHGMEQAAQRAAAQGWARLRRRLK
jgi:molybdate transport system regulatory protein